MHPRRLARFVRRWFAEWEPEPPVCGRATKLLMDLIEDCPDEGWERILALVAEAKEESLCYVGAGPLEDLLSSHGQAFIDRVEVAAANDPRFAACLATVWGHTRFESSVYKRVQKAVGSRPDVDFHPRSTG
jgi:hypothetical protein